MSVWSDKSYTAWANKSKCKKQSCFNSTTSGAFGSQSKFGNSGSKSLPTYDLGRKNSNLYKFELSSNGSTSYYSLGFGAEAKEYGWNASLFRASGWNSSATNMSMSGGSSRFSSGNVSLDWSTTIDGVFLDEIRNFAEGFNKKA